MNNFKQSWKLIGSYLRSEKRMYGYIPFQTTDGTNIGDYPNWTEDSFNALPDYVQAALGRISAEINRRVRESKNWWWITPDAFGIKE